MRAPRAVLADLEEAIYELQTHGGVLRFGSAASLQAYVESHPEPVFTAPIAAADDREMISDDVVRKSADPVNPHLLAVATAVTDVEALIDELRTAREDLEAEAARVRQANVQYEAMASAAASSARQTAEILRQWLNQERLMAQRDDD
jgi:hypothetical protein